MGSHARIASVLTCVALSVIGRPASAQEFSAEVKNLTRQYARVFGQCQLHAPNTAVGQEACPQVAGYEQRLRKLGWDPQQAKARLFDGCTRFGSAYQLAAISRANREPPESALKRLLSDKTLRITDPVLKSIVNTVYFEDWALRLTPLELGLTARDACRYGEDPKWQPLK